MVATRKVLLEMAAVVVPRTMQVVQAALTHQMVLIHGQVWECLISLRVRTQRPGRRKVSQRELNLLEEEEVVIRGPQIQTIH